MSIEAVGAQSTDAFGITKLPAKKRIGSGHPSRSVTPSFKRSLCQTMPHASDLTPRTGAITGRYLVLRSKLYEMIESHAQCAMFLFVFVLEQLLLLPIQSR